MTAIRARVSEDLPKLCGVEELQAVFGVSRATIDRWHKAGKLRRFELRRPVGSKRWSGRLLQDYADAVTPTLAIAKAG